MSTVTVSIEAEAREKQEEMFAGVHPSALNDDETRFFMCINRVAEIALERTCVCGKPLKQTENLRSFACSAKCGHTFHVGHVTDDDKLPTWFPTNSENGHAYLFAKKARAGFPEQCTINGTVRVIADINSEAGDYNGCHGIVRGVDMEGMCEVLISHYWTSASDVCPKQIGPSVEFFHADDLAVAEDWFKHLV